MVLSKGDNETETINAVLPLYDIEKDKDISVFL